MTPSLTITSVALRVPDLARSRDFYVRQAGFVVSSESGGSLNLATSTAAAPILELVEDRSAPLAPPRSAGLFHAALRLPHRGALAGWLRRSAQNGLMLDGLSDHGVSEAIYCSDPWGNGLEFYADRSHDQWPVAGSELAMVTTRLDVGALLAAATPEGSAPLEDSTWGHVHFSVRDLDRSDRFYGELLGMVTTQRSYPGARFLAADGYHHHVGLNSWSRPNRALPPEAAGLTSVTFASRHTSTRCELRDPDDIKIDLMPIP